MAWEVGLALKNAISDLKTIQKQDRKKRNESLNKWLSEAEEKAQTSDDPKAAQKAAKAIESIICAEHMKESYDRIRHAIKPRIHSAGLDRLDVPKRDAKGNEVYDKQGNAIREILLDVADIHTALLDWNKKHFHQAAETPFGSGILQDLMGFLGLSEAATTIVDGTFLDKHKMPDLLPKTKQLIMQLAIPETIKTLKKPISKEITRGDFMDGIKKWKECTSMSPSG